MAKVLFRNIFFPVRIYECFGSNIVVVFFGRLRCCFLLHTFQLIIYTVGMVHYYNEGNWRKYFSEQFFFSLLFRSRAWILCIFVKLFSNQKRISWALIIFLMLNWIFFFFNENTFLCKLVMRNSDRVFVLMSF